MSASSLSLLLFFLLMDLPAYAQEESWVNLNNQAVSLTQQGQFPAAIVADKKALVILQGTEVPQPLVIAEILRNLAWLYATQQQYALSEQLLKRALKMYAQELGPDHPEVADALNQLASVYRQAEQEQDAKQAEK